MRLFGLTLTSAFVSASRAVSEREDLMIADVFGLLKPAGKLTSRDGKTVNLVIDTGSQVSSLKESVLAKEHAATILQKVAVMAPSRSDLISFEVDESLSGHRHGVIGFGGQSPVGQKTFSLLPVGGSLVQYIDGSNARELRDKCILQNMSIDKDKLAATGEWVVPGTVSVNNHKRDVSLIIKTGGAGIELPPALYEKYRLSLTKRGFIVSAAEGKYEGFLFCHNCPYMDLKLPRIRFAMNWVSAKPSTGDYTFPYSDDARASIDFSTIGTIIAVKPSKSDDAIVFGGVLASQVAMVFDYPHTRLYMCNVPL